MLLLRYRGGFLKNNIILGLSHLQKPLFDLFFSYFLFQLWFPHKRFVHLLERSYHFIMITFLHQNIVPALHASKRDNVLQPGLLLQISNHIFPRRIFILKVDALCLRQKLHRRIIPLIICLFQFTAQRSFVERARPFARHSSAVGRITSCEICEKIPAL